MKKTLFLIWALVINVGVNAKTIYKCVEKDKIIFSHQACSEDPEVYIVSPFERAQAKAKAEAESLERDMKTEGDIATTKVSETLSKRFKNSAE